MIKLKDILSEGKKIKVGQRFNANGITWEVIKVGPTSSRAKAITKNKQFDPHKIFDNKIIIKQIESANEEVDKYGNVHAKTKKELKAAIAKAINLILKGKTPKFDIINGWSGEMISWKDGNEYVWQPNAIPYAERELK